MGISRFERGPRSEGAVAGLRLFEGGLPARGIGPVA
jgi:hypothetical protein